MSKVKLELQVKKDEELGTYATAHREAMLGNPNFTTPSPPPAVYDPVLDAFSAKMEQVAATENALEVLRAQRGDLRSDLEGMLTARGQYVQTASGGDAAKILSAAFQVQAEASPTTSLPKPAEVAATMGDNEGEVDVSCHAVPKAKSYVVERRDHSDVAAPGPWLPGKVGTRSTATIGGLESGKKYGFRVRALGPNELESPWSDEAVCMAP